MCHVELERCPRAGPLADERGDQESARVRERFSLWAGHEAEPRTGGKVRGLVRWQAV